jgi:hypothetical protein
MSILTECNYCKYQAIVKFQKKVGNRVVKIPSTQMEHMGGWDIHALKRGEKAGKGNWVAWMMEITDSCVC